MTLNVNNTLVVILESLLKLGGIVIGAPYIYQNLNTEDHGRGKRRT